MVTLSVTEIAKGVSCNVVVRLVAVTITSLSDV